MSKMDQIKAKLKEVVAFLNGEVEQPPVVEFNAALADGTNVVVRPQLEVGAEIFSLGADAAVTPLADGVVELSEGQILTVADGKISDIATKVEEVEMAEVKLTDEKLAEFENRLKGLEDKLADVSAARDEAIAAREATEAKLNETESKLNKVTELLMQLSEEPAEVVESVTKPVKQMSSAERAISMAEALKQIKKSK